MTTVIVGNNGQIFDSNGNVYNPSQLKQLHPSQQAVVATTQSIPVQWATTFLNAIGAPVTPNNIGNVIRWGQAESGDPTKSNPADYGGWANFNPLNRVFTTGDLSTGHGGQQGNIANYPDVNTGAIESANLFATNGNAYPIILALKADASTKTLNDAVNGFYSGWGGHIDFTGITPNLQGNPSTTGQGASSSPQANDAISQALGAIPIFGSSIKGAYDAGKSTSALAGAFLGIFTNWRYALEVVAGTLMILLGIGLIVADVGGKAAPQAAKVAAGAIE